MPLRRPGLCLVVGVLAGLAGCGGGRAAPPATVATSSPFPPRPAELPLDAVEPCALLSAAQRAQLGVSAGKSAEQTDELGSRACLWASHGNPDNRWMAQLVGKRGANYALGSIEGAQVVTISGYGAVQTTSPDANFRRHCILVIDVAEGQSLIAKYDNMAGDYPGIDHEVACQLDRRAAEFMVGNLRALAR